MDRPPLEPSTPVDQGLAADPLLDPDPPRQVLLHKQSALPEQREARKSLARVRTAVGSVPELVRKVPVQLQKTVADVVRLFAAIIEYLRTPLLILVLAPAVPGLVLLLASVARGGSDVAVAFALVAVGLVPSCWLGVRRHQLLHALQPPAEAAAEMYAAVGSPDVWNRIRANLGELLERPKKLRLRSLGRKVWRGVRMGFDLKSSIEESPRFAPFLPSRLRGLAYLAGWCLVSFLGLAALAAVKLLANSVGIG